MRITIEPTTDQSQRSSDLTQHRVVIEHPDDDLGLDIALDLVQAALAAYGYLIEPHFEHDATCPHSHITEQLVD